MTQNAEIKLSLDEKLANELILGVHGTMTKVFKIEPRARKYRLEQDCKMIGDVSGIIHLTRDKIDATIVLSFPKETIFKIMSAVYKQKVFSEIDQSVCQGVGELTNMIYGIAKTNLNKTGFGYKMAIPSVIIGNSHTVSTFNSGPTMVLPFDSDAGSFHVLMGLHT